MPVNAVTSSLIHEWNSGQVGATEDVMKARNLTIVTASAAMALMLMIDSAERAVAHHGWG